MAIVTFTMLCVFLVRCKLLTYLINFCWVFRRSSVRPENVIGDWIDKPTDRHRSVLVGYSVDGTPHVCTIMTQCCVAPYWRYVKLF